ncbi:hypothetical protein K2Y11_09690 [bacterium]|nr:hypothetical protein [bacterium]
MTDWQSKTRAIHVGDTVAYSKTFLQSTGQHTGDVPFARGKVTALIPLGSETTLAEIDWNNEELPPRVNVRNLTTIRGIQLGE